MNIARLLNPVDSDQSGQEQSESVVVYSPLPPPPPPLPLLPSPPPPPPKKAAARPRQRRSRNPSADSLKAKVEALQLVVDNLPRVLDDRNASSLSTSTYRANRPNAGDNDALRIRGFLHRTLLLAEQAHKEMAIKAEYRRLLKHHLEEHGDLSRLMRGLQLSDWYWMSDRWCTLTLKYYEPFSKAKCYAMMHETLQDIETHTLPESMTKTDTFGWRDAVHLEADEHYVRFRTHKTIRDADMKQIVDHKWSLYTDGDLHKKAHLGQNCELYHNTVQRISADAMIIQRVAKYQSLKQLTHSLALTFRAQTETGYMIVTRCIDSPQLDGLMKAEGLSLCGSFYWDTFDFADQDARGVTGAIQFTMVGSIGSDNPTYARRWRDEIVIALARYEAQLKGKSVVALLEASEKQDAVDTTDSEAVP